MVVGSSNLTGGLVGNVEIAAAISGARSAVEVATAWQLGEEGCDPAATTWDSDGESVEGDDFSPVLFDLIR